MPTNNKKIHNSFVKWIKHGFSMEKFSSYRNLDIKIDEKEATIQFRDGSKRRYIAQIVAKGNVSDYLEPNNYYGTVKAIDAGKARHITGWLGHIGRQIAEFSKEESGCPKT